MASPSIHVTSVLPWLLVAVDQRYFDAGWLPTTKLQLNDPLPQAECSMTQRHRHDVDWRERTSTNVQCIAGKSVTSTPLGLLFQPDSCNFIAG